MNAPVQTTPIELENAYLLFRLRGQRRLRRLTLPVTVGSHGACDLIVNFTTPLPLAYVLRSQEERLQCFGVRAKAPQPTDALAALGIQILGRAAGEAPKKLSLTQRLNEFYLIEAAFFAAQSVRIQRVLGGRWPQKRRLFVWASLLSLALLAVVQLLREPTYADLSSTPLTLIFGTPRTEIIGASPQRHGYERGALIDFEGPKNIAAQATLLTLKATALNLPGELTLLLNGRTIFASDVDAACIDTICTKQIAVPAGVVQPGHNRLQMVHSTTKSSYMAQGLLLQPLPTLSAEEREHAKRWIELARRFYDERGIVTDNLLAARIHVGRAQDLLARRTETDSLSAPLKVLHDEIESAFKEAVRDAWAEADLNERLVKPQELQRSLEALIRLFPNPASREHQKAKARLDALKEQVP